MESIPFLVIFLPQSKFKAFAEDKYDVASVIEFMFKIVENIVVKGENTVCQNIFLLSYFQTIVF